MVMHINVVFPRFMDVVLKRTSLVIHKGFTSHLVVRLSSIYVCVL